MEDKLITEMSAPSLLPAVTEKYCYLRVQKMWGDLTFRIGSDDTQGGLTFIEPAGKEVVVAFILKGKEDVKEEQLYNTLTVEQLIDLKIQQRDLLQKLTELSKPKDTQSF
jgi:hypothetical protein